MGRKRFSGGGANAAHRDDIGVDCDGFEGFGDETFGTYEGNLSVIIDSRLEDALASNDKELSSVQRKRMVRNNAEMAVAVIDPTPAEVEGDPKALDLERPDDLFNVANFQVSYVPIDREVVKKTMAFVPPKAADEAASMINAMAMEMDGMADVFRDNCVAWADVVSEDSKYSVEQYVKAVKFVTYRMGGATAGEAYAKTFPDRASRLQRLGRTNRDFSSLVRSYSTSKLVTNIYAQAIVPVHVMYNGVFNEVVRHQFYLAKNAKSEHVQMQASNSLLSILKPPEMGKVEMKGNVNAGDVIDGLIGALGDLAAAQKGAMSGGGVKMSDIRKATIIDVEAKENE